LGRGVSRESCAVNSRVGVVRNSRPRGPRIKRSRGKGEGHEGGEPFRPAKPGISKGGERKPGNNEKAWGKPRESARPQPRKSSRTCTKGATGTKSVHLEKSGPSPRKKGHKECLAKRLPQRQRKSKKGGVSIKKKLLARWNFATATKCGEHTKIKGVKDRWERPSV